MDGIRLTYVNDLQKPKAFNNWNTHYEKYNNILLHIATQNLKIP